MVLLMVTTVVYAPIVLPLLIPGVAVNPWAIAQPLITLMLIPLGIGLFVRAWRPDAASSLVPTLSQISNISLMLMAVLGLLIGYRELLAAIGTGAFMAAVSLIGGALIFGYLFASGDSTNRSVMGMGAGQRNISAALLVATSNFSDPNVIVMVLVASVVGLIILFLTAGFLGKRSVEPIVSPS
jgi:BASS family bile acid:Na+ symporter